MVKNGPSKTNRLNIIGEKMLVKLIEVSKPDGGDVRLSEVYINKDAVQMVQPEANTNLISEAQSLGILPSAQFSRITLVEGTIARHLTVVGSIQELKKKFDTRQLLRD
jgi:hypothetical protein